jgi:hypothetical protein
VASHPEVNSNTIQNSTYDKKSKEQEQSQQKEHSGSNTHIQATQIGMVTNTLKATSKKQVLILTERNEIVQKDTTALPPQSTAMDQTITTPCSRTPDHHDVRRNDTNIMRQQIRMEICNPRNARMWLQSLIPPPIPQWCPSGVYCRNVLNCRFMHPKQ